MFIFLIHSKPFLELSAFDSQLPPILIGEKKTKNKYENEDKITHETVIVITGLKPYETVKISNINIIVRGVILKDSSTNRE